MVLQDFFSISLSQKRTKMIATGVLRGGRGKEVEGREKGLGEREFMDENKLR